MIIALQIDSFSGNPNYVYFEAIEATPPSERFYSVVRRFHWAINKEVNTDHDNEVQLIQLIYGVHK